MAKTYNCIVVLNKDKTAALFCLRRNDPYKGLYNFVGGKVEPGETSETAAYRELEEETGLTGQEIRLFRLMDLRYYRQGFTLEIYVGMLQADAVLREEKNPLFWLPLTEDFTDRARFAGEQNIAHIMNAALEYPLPDTGSLHTGGKRPDNRVTVIGAAILDVSAGPVDFASLRAGSLPMRDITLSYGGDALNEAVILKRLGSDVELVSKTGADRAGDQILEFLRAEGIGHRGVSRDPALSTSVNIVLVDGRGERYFLTSPEGSLRRLEAQDILPFLDTAADIVSFTGVFVSPLLTIPAMAGIFERIRRVPGRILAADMTKAKHGERLQDLEPMLRYVDYIFPNEAEIALLTGEEDPRKNAELLVRAGVRCAVIKRGGKGCLVCDGDTLEEIPAYPVSSAVDSTGAGDAFVAGFLRGLQSGYTARECAVLGNAAASCVVECMGATEGFRSAEQAYKRFEEMMARLGK